MVSFFCQKVEVDTIRRDGEVYYTSDFTDSLKDISTDVYATKHVPELLNNVLINKYDDFYRKLHDNQRFIDLVKKIESDISM